MMMMKNFNMNYFAGVPKEKLDAKVNSLNVQYNKLRSGGETQATSLLSLVSKNPYRMLSKAAKKVFKLIN